MDQFYVVLPSNSCYETNTPSHFKSFLQNEIHLENPDDWQVALVDISFKNSLKTIQNDSILVEDYNNHNTSLYTLKFNMIDKKPKGFDLKLFHPELAEQHLFVKDNMNVFQADTKSPVYFSIMYRNNYFYLICDSSIKKADIEIPNIIAYACGFSESFTVPEIFYKDFDYNHLVTHRFKFNNIQGTLKAPHKPRVGELLQIPYRHPQTHKKIPYTFKLNHYKRKILHELQSGKYSSGLDLEKEMNTPSINDYFQILFNEKLNNFQILSTNKSQNAVLYLQNGLHNILGFDKTVFHTSAKEQLAEKQMDLERGVSNFYVYSDICQNVAIANSSAPLLRLVYFNTSNYGQWINIHYSKPMYMAINKSIITAIEINLVDAQGKEITFIEGITTIVLHFKRKTL